MANLSPTTAAIINLNGHAAFVHFWVVDLSLPNVIVILLAMLLFALAVVVPFPGSHADRSES